MAAKQAQALIDAIAADLRMFPTRDPAEMATATGMRRAIWASLTERQRAQVLRDARRRALAPRKEEEH